MERKSAIFKMNLNLAVFCFVGNAQFEMVKIRCFRKLLTPEEAGSARVLTALEAKKILYGRLLEEGLALRELSLLRGLPKGFEVAALRSEIEPCLFSGVSGDSSSFLQDFYDFGI